MSLVLEKEKLFENEHAAAEVLKIVDKDENDRQASVMIAGTKNISFYGGYIPALTFGAVATEPQYRRKGCVRTMFNELYRIAPERKWAVSVLNPFSSMYYEKFGYGITSKKRIVDFDLSFISNIPRCSDLKMLDSESRLADCLEIYKKFAEKRNGMFERFNGDAYSFDCATHNMTTYIWYDGNGKPASYIKCQVCDNFVINHMESVHLLVDELVFTTPESLKALFGFMRMFEGENDTVHLSNTAMCPEVELLIGETVETHYEEIAGIYARILDVKKVFEAVKYPRKKGQFTICIDDFLPYTNGVWNVSYENGRGICEKLCDCSEYEVKIKMPALSTIVFGYDSYNIDKAEYLPGVEIINRNTKFFDSFTKQPNGMFEHF